MIDRFTAKARESINLAVQAAEELGHSYVGTEHLLISIIRDNDCVASRLLNTIGISIQKLYIDVLAAMGEDAPANKEELLKGSRTKGSTPTLDSYSRDLTALAREGKLDPVIGRETEIKRLIQILSRRTKCTGNHCREARSDPGFVWYGGRVQIPW